MEADETLGERIRRLRVAHGMSRRDLAAAMRKLGARTEAHDIARYETDAYDPKLRTFAVLARVFEISLDALFYGEGRAGATTVPDQG